jgi:hypothetical protein
MKTNKTDQQQFSQLTKEKSLPCFINNINQNGLKFLPNCMESILLFIF